MTVLCSRLWVATNLNRVYVGESVAPPNAIDDQ